MRARAVSAGSAGMILCLGVLTACGSTGTATGDDPTPAVTASVTSPPATTAEGATPTPSVSATPIRTVTPLEATPPSPPASTPGAVPGTSATPGLLRTGDSGPAVRAVQKRLLALGYWIPAADGKYSELTAHAIVALQKAAGLSRDGVVGPRTREALEDGTRPEPASTSGHVVEIDLTRQLLLVVDAGKLRMTIDTSTGSGFRYRTEDGDTEIATTPTGTFKVSRQQDGWRDAPLGHLWRPKYFNGGIAVHGFPSVPAFAASHGCARVPMAAMNMIWGRNVMPIGTTVVVRGNL